MADDAGLLFSSYFNIRITHSETLMPVIDYALKSCKKVPADIKAIYLCNGPGSFTGLRIGLATAKGIAFARDLPVYSFDSLSLAALPLLRVNKKVISVLDARMGELYAAKYDEEMKELIPPCLKRPKDVAAWIEEGTVITGSGAKALRVYLEEKGIEAIFADETIYFSKAEYLFALKDKGFGKEHQGKSLMELEPLYLRLSTAQMKKVKL